MGATLNNFLIRVEVKILCQMVQDMVEIGLEPSTLCYDGIQVRRPFDHDSKTFGETKIPETALREIEKRGFEKHGWRFTLKVKEFQQPCTLKAIYNAPTPKKKRAEGKPETDLKLIERYFQITQEDEAKEIMIFPSGRFYVWAKKQKLWQETHEALAIGHIMAKTLSKDAQEDPELKEEDVAKILSRIESTTGQTAIGRQAKVSTDFHEQPCKEEWFDKKYPRLLPIANGKVIDLATLEVSDRKKEHYFTFEVPRNFATEKINEVDELFSEFLSYRNPETGEIEVDEEQYWSFKMAIGASLSAEQHTKALFVVQGDTNTGKTTFFETLSSVMETSRLISSVNKTIFTADRAKGSIASEFTSLEKGLRLGFCSEFQDDDKLNESQVKRLTGNDQITYRPFGRQDTTFKSMTKLWIFTNTMPAFNTTDAASVDRLTPFVFRNKFDRHNTKKYEAFQRFRDSNKDAIFSWWCQQAYEFYRNGKQIPIAPSMVALKQKIIDEKNPLVEFIDLFEELQECEIQTEDDCKDHGLTSGEIWRHYNDYLAREKPPITIGKKALEKHVTKAFPRQRSLSMQRIRGSRVRKVYLYRYVGGHRQTRLSEY
jgi:phage/plasmid-associated DNA primase